jgi:hypothetical protein
VATWFWDVCTGVSFLHTTKINCRRAQASELTYWTSPLAALVGRPRPYTGILWDLRDWSRDDVSGSRHSWHLELEDLTKCQKNAVPHCVHAWCGCGVHVYALGLSARSSILACEDRSSAFASCSSDPRSSLPCMTQPRCGVPTLNNVLCSGGLAQRWRTYSRFIPSSPFHV